MKNKFLSRIGQWHTPPYLRQCLTSFKALTLLLVMLLSVNVWGAKKTATYTVASATSLTVADAPEGASYTLTGNAALNSSMLQFTYGKSNTLTLEGYDGCKITGFSMDMKSNASAGLGSMSIKVGTTTLHSISSKKFNDAAWYGNWSSTSVTIDFTESLSSNPTVNAGETIVIEVSNPGTAKSANSIYVGKFSITYEEGDDPDPTEPSLSVSPTTIDFGVVAVGGSVDAQDVTATLTNTDYAIATLSGTNADAFEITAGAELTETGTITVQPKATTLATEGTYSATLEVEADGVDDSKTVTLSLRVAAPTGTFEKFTEDLEEGDYVICVGTDAMKNSVTSNRLDYASVTVSSDKITNPDASVIWHIASVSEGVWSIFNVVYDSDKGGYAAGTGTKNQAGILAATTDVSTETKAQWTCAKVTNGYNFENVANKVSEVNSKLQKNGTYGFACYAAFSDIVLYKKQVPAVYSAITLAECTNGSVSQTGAADITSVASGTTITLTNTPADGYKLDAYDVYKTGESETKVTVKEESGVYTFKMPAYDVTISATFSLSIETPTLSEAAGDKNDAINVKVSNYNSNYSYYYTLDGNDPTNASTPYVDADGIAINASCTLKVIAYQDAVTSPVASAAYNLPLMTMDAIFAAATAAGKTATNARVKFTNCVVTGVKNDNVYLTDNAGKGLIIYQSGHGFVVNDKLNGVVNVQVLLYNGSSEIKGLTSSTSGLTVTKDGSVSPITTIGIASLSGVNTGAVLSYENLVFDGDKSFSDGTNTIQPYNNFSIENYPTFENGDKYNVTGVYLQYSSTKEIMPRSLADLQKIEATKYAINLATVEHGTIATDPETEAADGVKVTLSATPAAGYMLGEWSVVDAESNPVEVTANQFTMPAMAVTVSATFVELPIWATTYTSNVTVGSDKVKLAEAYQPADYPEDGYDAKKDGTSSKAAAISIKVPANTTELHYHLFAWNGEGGKTVTIKKGEETLKTFKNVADASISGNSPYTLENNPVDAYGYVALEGITEETTITFSTTSGNQRIVLFGVNAIQPAAITIDPASKDFGEVKQDFDAEQVFTLTPNAFATGTITAEIDGEGFSASAVTDNKVTVTFAPTEIKDYSATLVIKHDGTQMCTATLTGKGIAATTPEIAVSDDEIDFGKVKQDASVTDKTVTVTLSYLDAATASISEGAFTINKTNLVAGENTITISATASSTGEKSATITITGTGATTKTIAVKMDVASKWAGDYNTDACITMSSSQNAKVVIDEEEYPAVKANDGANATITLPEGVTNLYFHAAAWNGEAVTLTAYKGTTTEESNKLGEFILVSDGGVKSSSPYTLQGENYDTDQYFHIDDLTDITEGQVITFVPNDNRYVIYGVHQEGGIVPILDHLTITGSATHTEYEVDETFDPAGLTVNAIYTLAGVEQDPVGVTDDVDWEFTPATLTAGSYDVTVKATYENKEVSTTVAVVVTAATPEIIVDATEVGFGTVPQNAEVDAKTVAVTLKAIAEATVDVAGHVDAFSVTPTSMTESGNITITPITTTAGEFTATITISADGAESKTITVTMTVTDGNLPKEKVDFTEVYSSLSGNETADFTGYSGVTFSLAVAKNDGTQPKYYANGSAVRAYAKNTITISSEKTIAFILINHTGKNYQDVEATVDKGTLKVNEAYSMWTLGATSGTITLKNTVRFDNIIIFYEYDEVVRSAQSENQIGTGCQTLDIVAAKGATLYQVNYTYSSYLEFMEVTYPVKAGMPIIMQADGTNDGKIELIYGEKNEEAEAGLNKDGLYGYIGTTQFDIPNDEGYYVFKGGILRPALDNYTTSGHAYIKLDEVPTEDQTEGSPAPRRRLSVGVERSMPTGFETIMMQKGMNKVIMNNQLFIIRDGKVFNAQGALVK